MRPTLLAALLGALLLASAASARETLIGAPCRGSTPTGGRHAEAGSPKRFQRDFFGSGQPRPGPHNAAAPHPLHLPMKA